MWDLVGNPGRRPISHNEAHVKVGFKVADFTLWTISNWGSRGPKSHVRVIMMRLKYLWFHRVLVVVSVTLTFTTFPAEQTAIAQERNDDYQENY